MTLWVKKGVKKVVRGGGACVCVSEECEVRIKSIGIRGGIYRRRGYQSYIREVSPT